MRYTALLVTIATLVLVVGALLRPKAQQPAVQTNGLATLPELSQRRMLRDMASYVRERAAVLATSVVYLPTLEASGLVVGQDSILSVSLPTPRGAALGEGSSQLLLLRSPGGGDSAQPVRPIAVDSLGARWILVVARAPDRRPLALTGLTGGLVPVQCGDIALRELLFDALVPLGLRGAGVFDLDGNALALAVPCTDRIALIPLVDAFRALEQQRMPEHRLWARYGFRVTAMDSLTRRVLRGGGEWVVAEVLVGAPADRAGLWPGDVVQVGASPTAADSAPLASLLESAGAARLTVTRAGKTLRLVLDPDAESAREFGSTPVTPGPALLNLEPGSRAARAGLRAGDRVLQAGRRRPPTAGSLRLALATSGPVFLVYERNGRRRSVVLP